MSFYKINVALNFFPKLSLINTLRDQYIKKVNESLIKDIKSIYIKKLYDIYYKN